MGTREEIIDEMPREKLVALSGILRAISRFAFGLRKNENFLLPVRFLPVSTNGLNDTFSLLDDLESKFHVINVLDIGEIELSQTEAVEMNVDDVPALTKLSILVSEKIKVKTRKIDLSKTRATYDGKRAEILVEDRVCKIPFSSNQNCLARMMFSKGPKTPIDWDCLFEEMTGDEPVGNPKVESRKVRDAVYALNKRVKNSVGTEQDLFTWKDKRVIRNY